MMLGVECWGCVQETPASKKADAKAYEPNIEDFKGEDDLPDDNDPAEPTPRLDIDPGPGLGPRDGFVHEGWRDAIDVVLDDDNLNMRQAADDEVIQIREVQERDEEWSQIVENKDTGERVFADELALDKCVISVLAPLRLVQCCAVLCCVVMHSVYSGHACR